MWRQVSGVILLLQFQLVLYHGVSSQYARSRGVGAGALAGVGRVATGVTPPGPGPAWHPREAVWTAWSPWSQCSLTCGRGTHSRYRACVGRDYRRLVRRLDATSCSGQAKEYEICIQVPCSPWAVDLWVSQCAQHNSDQIKNQTYEWVPFFGGGNPCELRCMARGHAFYYDFGKVTDGTPCQQGSEDQVCVNSHCGIVGCDRKVDSGATLDNCRVCGGNDVNCVLYKNAYTVRNPPKYEIHQYQQIVKIPKGATRVEITDNSSNHIAIADMNKAYIVNGRGVIDWTGKYETGGTTFFYSHTGDSEVIRAEGPTTEDFYVMLIFRDVNPGVSYQFYIPADKLDEVLLPTAPSPYIFGGFAGEAGSDPDVFDRTTDQRRQVALRNNPPGGRREGSRDRSGSISEGYYRSGNEAKPDDTGGFHGYDADRGEDPGIPLAVPLASAGSAEGQQVRRVWDTAGFFSPSYSQSGEVGPANEDWPDSSRSGRDRHGRLLQNGYQDNSLLGNNRGRGGGDVGYNDEVDTSDRASDGAYRGAGVGGAVPGGRGNRVPPPAVGDRERPPWVQPSPPTAPPGPYSQGVIGAGDQSLHDYLSYYRQKERRSDVSHQARTDGSQGSQSHHQPDNRIGIHGDYGSSRDRGRHPDRTSSGSSEISSSSLDRRNSVVYPDTAETPDSGARGWGWAAPSPAPTPTPTSNVLELSTRKIYTSNLGGTRYYKFLPDRSISNIRYNTRPLEGTTPAPRAKTNTRTGRKETTRKKKRRKPHCRRCKRNKGLTKQFCQNGVVSRIRVMGYEFVNNETRYDMRIVQSFKAEIPLLAREFAWILNDCPCPKLAVNKEYLITGNLVEAVSRDTRLVIQEHNFVRAFSDKLAVKLQKLQTRKCKRK